MSNPCPTFDCPCGNNPLTGYLSEAPDVIAPLATAYVQLEPPFGTEYCNRGCVAFASEVLPPPGAGITPQTPEFFSVPQSCAVACPDGTMFTFEVTAGAFTATTQAAADAAALAYACQQANALQLCLGDLSPTSFTANTPYSGSITASGGGLGATNNWQIIAGSLPTGLTFNGGTIAGNTVTITGTPTISGQFTFTVQITNAAGGAATKTYVMNCLTGYAIITNVFPSVASPTNVGFVAAAPDGGFDTKYQTAQPAPQTNGGNYIKINFTSNASKTWNIKASVTIIGGTCFAYLKINGASQSFTFVGNTGTFTGTFATAGCNTPTVIEMDVGPAAGGAFATGFLEWLTPA